MGPLKLGSLDEECKKAANILKAFIDKKKIPADVIANAKGISIFTGFRGGMAFAGSSGSGIVVARLQDGSWSTPSAFSVRSGGIGIVYGFDVYDCICVLNTTAAVEAYTKPEVHLGLAAQAGPASATTAESSEAVLTYTKARGLYGGVTVDGVVIKERADVNEKAYGVKVTPEAILNGGVTLSKGKSDSTGLRQLQEVLKLAGGEQAKEAELQHIDLEEASGDA